MKAFMVEYVEPGFLLNESDKAKYQPVRQKGMISVVRLPEVDAVIAETVWAMYELAVERRSSLADLFDLDTDSQEFGERLACDKSYQRAQDFLTSPLVAAWRERQEKNDKKEQGYSRAEFENDQTQEQRP